MVWVRIDEGFTDHPKLQSIGDCAPLAGWQLLCILSYCNRFLTDGHIRQHTAHGLVRWRHVGVETAQVPGICGVGNDMSGDWACSLLEKAGLLELCSDHADCYRVHDFLDYQPSRSDIETQRAKTTERVKRWRAARNGVTNAVGNGVGNAAPDPSRPVVLDVSNEPSKTSRELAKNGGSRQPNLIKVDRQKPKRYTPEGDVLAQEIWPMLDPKPMCGFVGFRERISEMLGAGYGANDIMALAPRIEVWSRAGIEVAVARTRPRAAPENPVDRRIRLLLEGGAHAE